MNPFNLHDGNAFMLKVACTSFSYVLLRLNRRLQTESTAPEKQMQQMVDRINEQDADLVVIAGDIFDNEWEAVEDPETIAATLRSIRSKYGVYACYGNHDIEEPVLAGFTFRQSEKKESDPRMDEFLKNANITLLRDEGSAHRRKVLPLWPPRRAPPRPRHRDAQDARRDHGGSWIRISPSSSSTTSRRSCRSLRTRAST